MSKVVGITFTDQPPPGIVYLNIRDKHCRFIGRARREAFYIRAEDISCPLARFYLGIGRTKLKELARTLVGWGDAADLAAGLAYLKTGSCFSRSSPYLVYFPYPRGDIKPAVLITIGTASEIQISVQEICARTGMRIKSSLSGIGAACGECTAYPLVTGQANVSVGCNGSRPGIGLKSGELLFALPFNLKSMQPIRLVQFAV
ncbi:MAG: DUF169 domain-containing protein [Candidatus Euphemobacter frigidus]|nr:DUF169 domain-containing protein [Candidatus Euphemobacter frigidus]MDP8275849.1 DUF169 domain-containing protein [Candidatus Euphemobacter frigidus]